MNLSPHVDPHKSGQGVWAEFSQSFTPAVREVVEFAKKIPGFRDLSQHDQVSLLKAGTFEVRPPHPSVCWPPVAATATCPSMLVETRPPQKEVSDESPTDGDSAAAVNFGRC